MNFRRTRSDRRPVTASPEARRDWRLFLTGQVTSTLGTQATAIILPALAVLHLHANVLAAGLILPLEYVPGALLSPWAGAVVDRTRLRNVLIPVDVTRGLLLGGCALILATIRPGIWPLYLVAALVGALSPIFDAAAEVLVPSVVASTELARANAQRAALNNVARVAGPALGGIILSIGPSGVALYFDAVTYGISAALIAAMRSGRLTASNTRTTQSAESESLYSEIRAAARLIRSDDVLFRGLLGMTLMNFGGSGVGAVFYVYVYDELHLNAREVGLAATCFSLGAVAGAVLSSRVSRALGRGRTCAWSAAIAAGALLFLCFASLGTPLVVLIIYQFAFGFAATVWFVVLATLRQARTLVSHLGRVSALSSSLALAAVPIGSLLSIGIALASSTTMAILVMALISCLAPPLYWSRRFREAADAELAPAVNDGVDARDGRVDTAGTGSRSLEDR